MRRIGIVVGTRPQIIKTAPVIRRLAGAKACEMLIIHTGQHFDFGLSRVFFNEMQLPDPTLNLGVQESTQATQTAAMLIGLERALAKLRPDILLIPGDTNSALAAALAAVKLRIPYAHLEAGPRQFDMSNPEEANRVVVDHLSTLAFAPCMSSIANLRREGFGRTRLKFTGDTMLDCLMQHELSVRRISVAKKFHVEPGFVFVTIHRQENTEERTKLKHIVHALLLKKRLSFVFSVHPRTKKCLKRYGLWRKLLDADNVRPMSPLDYESTLAMVQNAALVLTDSGGLQKEAFWLATPCVTVFRTTPWPETLGGGANRCIDADTNSLLSAIEKAMSTNCKFERNKSFRLFGNGRASEMVCRFLI